MSHVFLDIETSGLDPDVHQVWEIAYAVGDGPIHRSFVKHTLDDADDVALELTHYHERYVEPEDGGQRFEELLQEALAGATVVAANPAFDTSFLAKRWGARPWHYRLLDVEAFAMPHLRLSKPKGLADICRALGVREGDHTAERDVMALRQCYHRLRVAYGLGW
jgi:DNA polymerase-3 subunit epsilon